MGILSKWTQRQSSALRDQTGAQNTGLRPNSQTTDPTLVKSNRNYLVLINQNQDVPTVPGMGTQPMLVAGQIAQDFQIDQAVKWATPWGAGLAGDGTISDVLAVTTGNRLVAQVATLQVWQGAGNDIDFTVSFELRAWSSTALDVMNPLQYLLAMSMPSIDDSGFLRSPGPILDDTALAEIGQIIPKTVSALGSAVKDAAVAVYNGVVNSTTSDGQNEALATAKGTSEAAKKLKTAIGTIAKKNTLDSKMKNKISITIGQWFSLDNIVITNVQHTLKPQMPGPDGGLMAADVTVSFRPMFALTTADIPSILRAPR